MLMTNPIPIRRAVPDDVAACAAVANGWIDQTEWLARVHSHEMVVGFVEDGMKNRTIWVAGDPIDGYLSFNPETNQVGALFCRKTGAGLGKALMDKAKENVNYLWLTTHVPNINAQRFYAREGFHEVSRFDPEPPETVREIKMEWHA